MSPMLLQVDGEPVLEVPESDFDVMKPLVARQMEDVYKLNIPVKSAFVSVPFRVDLE